METDALEVMAEVYQSVISGDGRYLATETFKGTIDIFDVGTKQRIARKQKTPLRGKTVFTRENQILYFFEDNIRLWDFSENTDRVVWRVPEKWKEFEDPSRPIHIVCNNIFYNSREEAYFVVLDAREATYVVSLKDMVLDRVVQLPGIRAYCKLLFEENLNRYTLPVKERVIVYDEDFQTVETIVPPRIVKNHDGGGVFPVTRHWIREPSKVFLSPDGKWLLMDYLGTLVLLRHEDLSIRFCLYSYTGRTVPRMGFVDASHFWYTWGDTTYIQEIER